jgi:hypothetical protein
MIRLFQYSMGLISLIAIIDTSSIEEKSFHKAYERSNKPSLTFMRMSKTNNIKFVFPKTESAKESMTFVEEHS